MLSYETRSVGMAPPTPPDGDDQIQISAAAPRSNNISKSVTKDASRAELEHSHIWLISGPAGCGKSTVAQFISNSLGVPYIEGDEFHPQSNVDKMAAGEPLTDADRWDWLIRLREEAMQKLDTGSTGVVVTCSALKRKYRDVMRVAQYYSHNVRLHFIYLHATEEVLLERVGARKGHYMGANMVKSQFGILEPPGDDETDVVSVDVSGTPEEVRREALRGIELAVQQEGVRKS